MKSTCCPDRISKLVFCVRCRRPRLAMILAKIEHSITASGTSMSAVERSAEDAEEGRARNRQTPMFTGARSDRGLLIVPRFRGTLRFTDYVIRIISALIGQATGSLQFLRFSRLSAISRHSRKFCLFGEEGTSTVDTAEAHLQCN